MAKQQTSKLQLLCEACGYQAEELEVVKKFFLYCKECTEADKRRERFKREEIEWNRGVDQKDSE